MMFKKQSFFFATLVLFAVPGVLFAEGDDVAPVISGVKVASTTETAATITWTTDEVSDSLINYGLDRNYGIARDPAKDKKTHSVDITGLDPSTAYYFRVISNDPDGNQSVSGGLYLVTKGSKIPGLEKVKDVKQRAISEKILNLLEKLTDAEAIKLLLAKVKDAAKNELAPPTIIGTPVIKELSTDYVIVSWTTDRESSTMATFSSEKDYAEGAFPYTFTQGDPGSRDTAHEIKVIGLAPNTKYHLRVFSDDDAGLSGRSEDTVFTTKSILPVVRNFQIVKVEDTSATLSWNTSAPAAGAIEYTNTATKEVKSKGSPEFLGSHIVRLEGLSFGTRYTAVVKAENESGDKIVSEPISFITIKDESPPIISKVTNESTLYPTADAKVQTIINWNTDEPSFCQFFYRQSLAQTGDAVSLAAEEFSSTAHVQVVVDFQPSTVYKFWVECKDRTGNQARSEDFVLFTPDKEKSILDIIIENFQGTFGWVKNIGK
ncbi:MAG: fibronectin type III domain-containing protein [Parcubacteria group bacterium]|nr:fibronectin type III domain-containing protein [Parcubacteria group bacterium]